MAGASGISEAFDSISSVSWAVDWLRLRPLTGLEKPSSM